MNNAFVRIRRKGPGQVYTYTILFNTRIHLHGDLAFPEKQYESVFVEVDKTFFNTTRSTIIGEIYNPPSSK